MRSRRSRNNTSSRPLLGSLAVKVARAALTELDDGVVGRHVGVTNIGRNVATHRFEADVPGYDGWEWNVVVACAEGSRWVTVSELALVPGGSALRAPEWVPYHERVQPGDLGPDDQLPARPDDPRLTVNPDDAVNMAPNRPHPSREHRALSRFGLEQTLDRWQHGEYGPTSDFATHSALKCNSCAFYLPLSAEIAPTMGVCANEYSADGCVVTSDYGCGAHSDTPPAEPLGTVEAVAFDDEKTIEVEI